MFGNISWCSARHAVYLQLVGLGDKFSFALISVPRYRYAHSSTGYSFQYRVLFTAKNLSNSEHDLKHIELRTDSQTYRGTYSLTLVPDLKRNYQREYPTGGLLLSIDGEYPTGGLLLSIDGEYPTGGLLLSIDDVISVSKLSLGASEYTGRLLPVERPK
jgi:hypothetical protein